MEGVLVEVREECRKSVVVLKMNGKSSVGGTGAGATDPEAQVEESPAFSLGSTWFLQECSTWFLQEYSCAFRRGFHVVFAGRFSCVFRVDAFKYAT